jgi:hypothetical protein
MDRGKYFNPLCAELNPIYHFLALLGAQHIFHFSGLRVNLAGNSVAESLAVTWGPYCSC